MNLEKRHEIKKIKMGEQLRAIEPHLHVLRLINLLEKLHLQILVPGVCL